MGKKRKGVRSYLRGVPYSGLGNLVAEEDKELERHYVDRDRFVARALSKRDPATFFAGPKGVGKSAILQMVRVDQARESKRLIDISPDDLAFSALARLELDSPLLSDHQKNQWLFKSLWDYVLVLEIVRREHGEGLFAFVKRLFKGRPNKEAERLLRLSVSEDGTPVSMTTRILQLVREIEVAGPGGVSAKLRVGPGESGSGKLNLLSQINHLAKKLPGSLRHPYFVLIDDLDLHWCNDPVQASMIAALFSAVRRLSSPNVRFVVSLRDDIYDRLPLEDRDKTRDRVCRVRWEQGTLKKMLRVRVAHALGVPEAEVWGGVFTRGAFEQMRLKTRGLPRELIRLAGLAIESAIADGNGTVSDSNVREAVEKFSRERLDDLASEHQYIYPGLNALMRLLSGGPREFAMAGFEEFADRAIQNVTGSKPCPYAWVGGYIDDVPALARTLLECGVLQFKPSRRDRPVPWDCDNPIAIRDSSWFAVDPMLAVGLNLVGTRRDR